MRKKTIFFAGTAVCLLILAAAFYWYQKPRAGLMNTKPDYSMEAKELYTAFQQNEQKANSRFIEKVILVKGTVDDVQAADSTINILLSGSNGMGGVNCSVSKDNNTLPALPLKGTVIQIKGRCVGFLMDVNLTDAVIEK
jgi:DNA/RNA endonuclease YhcR with UshA esterase domain